jgi:hypothetical protein
VAPGVPDNRPQTGSAPLRKDVTSANGHTLFLAQTWYDGLEIQGNTSINPFFYGTYLAETRPFEPVTRSKEQAFQADAVGVIHQLNDDHFEKPHTFRLEWQPGPGGRLDWFVKDKENSTSDGSDNWIRAFTLKDQSLAELMGSQIPIEPSYLIMNTAVSSTWGFPYDSPVWCPECYDCDDPKCACRFYPGFCQMIRSNRTAMYIDSVRVYQSFDDSAHVGAPHSLGCDPPDYPTKEWIDGHDYLYSRQPPFGYLDRGPLKRIQRGGGNCKTDADCGGEESRANLTKVYQEGESADGANDSNANVESSSDDRIRNNSSGRGQCVPALSTGMLSTFSGVRDGGVCMCHPGFTGPHCLALVHVDVSPSAYVMRGLQSPFRRISNFEVPSFMFVVAGLFSAALLTMWLSQATDLRRARSSPH